MESVKFGGDVDSGEEYDSSDAESELDMLVDQIEKLPHGLEVSETEAQKIREQMETVNNRKLKERKYISRR